MMNYTVIDLFCGIGGMSQAFQRAGFDIVAAIDDSKNIDIYQSIMGENIRTYDVLNVDISQLPNADIITSKILPYRILNKSLSDEKRFHILYDMIKQIEPKMFLIEISKTFMFEKNRPYSQNILEMLSTLGYNCSYQVLDEGDFSKFPVVCTRLYITGIRTDIFNNNFLFPQTKQSKYDIKIEYSNFSEVSDDRWYSVNSKIDYMSLQPKKIYKREIKGFREIRNIYLSAIYETIVLEKNSLRRLTHNEIAIVRQLIPYNYNKMDNRKHVYHEMILSSNVCIAYEIAKNITKYLNGDYIQNISVKSKPKQVLKSKNSKKEVNGFPKYRITNIHIHELKGLKNLNMDINKNLIAIMGVNGCGKSTILHALSCMYAPYENTEDYKFSFFFTPNPDSDWSQSRLLLTHYDERSQKEIIREYKKNKDRWSPRYNNRPKRDTYFLGIKTCIPEIEIEKQTSYIDYLTNEDDNKNAHKIIKDAAHILNKNYEWLTLHKTKKKTLMGVHTSDDLTYSSLSMGAGEQRIIKILRTVYAANQYSLILIDEIDLLLHVTALKRLIIRLSKIADEKHLQIFFTTHSLVVNQLSEYLDICYLEQVPNKTLVYNSINHDMIYELSDIDEKPLEIYVEDMLAETIIKRVADDLDILSKVNVNTYGASSNAFVISGSYILKGEKRDNVLIVLDGDTYKTDKEKEKQMKKILSGTENEYNQKIDDALSIIEELVLPENCPPERFIYNLLISSGQDDKELVKMAKRLHAVSDSHQWLDELVKRMGHDEKYILNKIIEIVAIMPKWGDYVIQVHTWMKKKKIELNL